MENNNTSPSFMTVIDNLDNVIKQIDQQEYIEYLKALKTIFIGIEQTNIKLSESLNAVNGNKVYEN